MYKRWKNKKKKNKQIIHQSPTQIIFSDGTSERFKNMEQIQNEEVQKKFLEKKDQSEENTPEPETFSVREYKCKFLKVTAYKLAEDSTIHCVNGDKLFGKAGEYYVCLDKVQEFVLPREIFKKMFLVKLEN